ncbi:dTDP-glucose 4,6-dehydratase [Lutibacter sp. TH_r2]|uniref:dTDP-glucose 4,6-dehydratase n=1 Tax=Lutibacter sp. TH_r2 TaxID=3082083 RepID=UPI002955C463|nr:dTDP-glucose 4,6-dehydratase [Lutibacter sp. TH_r2]MDV7187809.1 dTDP-glucose 4,6-dehydratase [Lutibacter sp. TH_r2]
MEHKSILVTGGAGFIGSNLLQYMVKKYPNNKFVCLDLLTYAGNSYNVDAIKNEVNFTFVEGSICDRSLVERIFQFYRINGVIHLAAESHVDNSITGPEIFIDTNIKGTFTLLDVAYKYWMDAPHVYKEVYSDPNKKGEFPRFLHVSTDEVYGTLGKKGLFTEKTPYAPNSPYSASKASSDMLVRSYHHTFGLNIIITNCSNNYGPYQHNEKLIPTVIRKALKGEKIPIYGNGSNVRDWLYVNDHCTGIDIAYHKGVNGEVYNIGGDNERDNNYIANKICELLDEKVPKNNGSYKDQIEYVEDRAGHDFRYAIDASKIKNDLGWNPQENFESGIQKTVDWYVEKYKSEL